MSVVSRILVFIGAMSLIVCLFVPLWRIELLAPQYPEGLVLLLYPDEIGGNVETINGLNHYIGMKTLHTENFIEFSILKYIIYFFIGLVALTAILGNRKLLVSALVLFLLFGIVSMIDFYRWNYDYGHDLDPNAAIKVPGQAYQPPVIGFKQLLNFGAYSIPDTGGWMFIFCGTILLATTAFETGLIRRIFKKKGSTAGVTSILVLGFMFAGCNASAPDPITLNSDKCNYCRMSIADQRFACEYKTEKGKAFKFDDLACLLAFQQENTDQPLAHAWAFDYAAPSALLPVGDMSFVAAEDFRSPMGGNIAAYSSRSAADADAVKYNTQVLSWGDLKKR